MQNCRIFMFKRTVVDQIIKDTLRARIYIVRQIEPGIKAVASEKNGGLKHRVVCRIQSRSQQESLSNEPVTVLKRGI